MKNSIEGCLDNLKSNRTKEDVLVLLAGASIETLKKLCGQYQCSLEKLVHKICRAKGIKIKNRRPVEKNVANSKGTKK